jgi:hypothetical protein
LASADVFLLATLALGSTLAGNLRFGYLEEERLSALGAHLHVALAGWVLLVVVGVAQRLLPMSLVSHGAGGRFAKTSVALLAAGSATLLAVHEGPQAAQRCLAAALLAAGLACFLVQALQFFRHRHRPALDPGMRLAAAALGPLAGRRPVPRVSELYSAWAVFVAGTLLAVGAAGRCAR